MTKDTADIIGALQTALKSRKISYRQVAERLDVSEKTVKRLFRDKDCSLSRLSKICDVINLSLHDLIDFSKVYSEQLICLTEKQESFLRNNPHHFSFLFLLTVGHTAEQIQTQNALSNISLFRYLRDLDKNGFIELAEKNRYRLLVKGKLLVALHGPLHKVIRDQNAKFLQYVIDNDGKDRISFQATFRYMSEQTLSSLNQDMAALSNTYKKLAHQDEAILSRDKLIPVKWCQLVAPFNIFTEWEIDELTR